MRRIKLTLQYNGTPFYGWQRINEGPSVQGAIEDALKKITHEDITLQCAGRTDKGVHALGQVAHFDTNSALPLVKFFDGITHYTRPHIAITQVEEVPSRFHARHSATARAYIYKLHHGQRHMPPTWHNRATHIRPQLNVALMQEAIALLPLGEGDFSAFRSSACESGTPMVDLQHFSLTEDASDAHLLHLSITANHFLHNMIRILMGTLVDIGLEEQPSTHLLTVFKNRKRTEAGITLCPDGLYLAKITYPENVKKTC